MKARAAVATASIPVKTFNTDSWNDLSSSCLASRSVSSLLFPVLSNSTESGDSLVPRMSFSAFCARSEELSCGGVLGLDGDGVSPYEKRALLRRIEQTNNFLNRPYMTSNPRLHGWRDAESWMDSSEIVKHEIEREFLEGLVCCTAARQQGLIEASSGNVQGR
jgi:hypothetical protein